MNTAHTPQALSLPHLQIAEVSARRQDENHAFDRAAARLRPAWLRDERRDAPAVAIRADEGALKRTMRQHALVRSNSEADRYRRQLLGDLDRNQRTVRGLFIAAVVATCAVLGLSDGSPTPAAHRAAPRAATAAVVTAPKPVNTPTAPAVHEPAPAPARAVSAPQPTPAHAAPAKIGAQPAWKPRAPAAQPAWKPRAPAARLQGNVPAANRPAIAPKRAAVVPARAALAPTKP